MRQISWFVCCTSEQHGRIERGDRFVGSERGERSWVKYVIRPNSYSVNSAPQKRYKVILPAARVFELPEKVDTAGV